MASKTAHTSAKTSRNASFGSEMVSLPYGEQQGSFRGVVVSSNRDDGFFSGESNYISYIIYTGYRYQCVEYARRFLLLTTGCIFAGCGRASEIFKMKHITHVETARTYPFIHHHNGKSSTPPAPGDIIIYPYHPELTPWGHVGVISYVDEKRVGIAEQNQRFTSFFSPDPNYLDGEKCVGRFVDLEHDAAAGTWRLREPGSLPDCLGWLSYPDAPQRELIYAPLNPVPEQISVRKTPIDDPAHPVVYRFQLPTPVELGCGDMQYIYGMKQGAGECFVGTVTASARILRFTLQLLFRRDHLGSGFLNLVFNPLHATVGDDNHDVNQLFEVMRTLGDEVCNESSLLPALAAYFAMPVEWLQAMQREFSRGELHFCSSAAYSLDLAETKTIHNGNEQIAALLPSEFHDECWCLKKMSFNTPRLLVDLLHMSTVVKSFPVALEFLIKNHRFLASSTFGMDFGNYLKAVELCRGPRSGFTIALAKEDSNFMQELITALQSYCERLRYPVWVVAEEDLRYDEASGRLMAFPSKATPPPASPSEARPPAELEVNFIFTIADWEDILHHPDEHAALYAAALHPSADVVFAKPLWSYLCTGLVNRTVDSPEVLSPSIKFFDIARRLYDFALPKQPAQTWDQEVSEFKDSCRRAHLKDLVQRDPPGGFVGDAALINFAISAMMGHTGTQIVEDRQNTGEHDGQPSGFVHMFEEEQ